MRDMKARIARLQARVAPSKVECSGACAGFRMYMLRRDAETGEQFTVCSADYPLWRTVKATDWPATIREYDAFKREYAPERARAHQAVPCCRTSGAARNYEL